MPIIRILIKLLPLIILVLVSLFIWRACRDYLSKEKPEPAVTVTHHTVLTQIEELGKLELVRYNFKDVVEYSKSSRWLPDSKIALIVAGEAVGCIDLRKLTEQDITFEGDSVVQVRLPAPEICYYKVDHSQSKVFSMSNTYFQDAELVDEAYKYAEKNVERSARNSGILLQTNINAEKILKPTLEAITGRRVVLLRQEKTQAPQLPAKR